jgi:hypothetical protein
MIDALFYREVLDLLFLYFDKKPENPYASYVQLLFKKILIDDPKMVNIFVNKFISFYVRF